MKFGIPRQKNAWASPASCLRCSFCAPTVAEKQALANTRRGTWRTWKMSLAVRKQSDAKTHPARFAFLSKKACPASVYHVVLLIDDQHRKLERIAQIDA